MFIYFIGVVLQPVANTMSTIIPTLPLVMIFQNRSHQGVLFLICSAAGTRHILFWEAQYCPKNNDFFQCLKFDVFDDENVVK